MNLHEARYYAGVCRSILGKSLWTFRKLKENPSDVAEKVRQDLILSLKQLKKIYNQYPEIKPEVRYHLR